ncbi:lactonase family protein [Edaphobacter bradus]|uniref:lactonase family protein n=1 Tax=Edaphobacter bradus TaxID=2259016 RepID=UPI0021DF8F15|nr:beta-propeller fold lactonase family protein [Edaphobacter bradus]
MSVAMGLGMTACGGGTIGYLWVLGTQYNQIVGYKIDDFTGNLTQVLHSPFSTNGTTPVSIVVKAGGRYVYVVNKGTTGSNATPGNISVFSVGSGGTLTFQTQYSSRGSTPVWATIDSSGSFLYVLDTLYPDTPAYPNPNGYGDITVFAIDANTGRLQLVPNQQIKDSNQTQLTFFPVGPKPIMSKVTGSGCLFTINSGDQTIFPYSIGSNGQLTVTANSTVQTGAGNLTSINSNGSYVYLTDAAATTDSPGGRVLPYTAGSNCSLNTLTGGAINNLGLTSNPTYSMVDSQGKYLYVLNRSSTNSQNPATSSISAFTIDSATGKLQTLNSTNNPFSVGSGPVCVVEDPTNQYIYTSNNISGTVTGKLINKHTGELADLQRGSNFPATGLATCLAVSGNVN